MRKKIIIKLAKHEYLLKLDDDDTMRFITPILLLLGRFEKFHNEKKSDIVIYILLCKKIFRKIGKEVFSKR